MLALSIALPGCESGVKKEAELELAAARAALEQTKEELADVSQSRDRLQGQIKDLIKSRDTAVAEAKKAGLRIDELTKKFEEQAKIIRELQEHMQKMQATIEKL
jgi:chromosome segregation ATPase